MRAHLLTHMQTDTVLCTQAVGPIHYQRQQIVIDSVRLLTRQTACLYPNLPQASGEQLVMTGMAGLLRQLFIFLASS